MSSSSRDDVITNKILRKINDIESFAASLDRAGFLEDIKTQKAVVISLINIGYWRIIKIIYR